MNILLAFGATGNTVSEILAREKHIATALPVSKTGGQGSGEKFRIYASEPISWFAEGESVDFNKIGVKIADFGLGMANIFIF